MELRRLLRNGLTPAAPTGVPFGTPGKQPPTLTSLCIRTAAIYATTSLYEFHDKHRNPQFHYHYHNHPHGTSGAVAGQAALLTLGTGGSHMEPLITESLWEEVFPLLDQHFFQLVPWHLYEQFLDYVLRALEIANRFDLTGKQLPQYIILFFPKHMKRYRALSYIDKVLLPTINCLQECTNLEELYLEKADSQAVTPYLIAHILKHTINVKVLSLPKQCDDDVASVIGINCKKLESIVLAGTSMTNIGLLCLICCRNLHTVILPGFFGGITPKGVALLLNGLPGLCHVVYDVMSDVLTYIDFNTSPSFLPRFGLKTLLLHSMELLSTNHMELVTKLCPSLEWLSLDSALFYNLEGLGHLPNLTLLRLNYKGRPLDQTVVDFFHLNCHHLTTLHLFEVKDIALDELQLTIGHCKNLDILVMCDCSMLPEWIGHSMRSKSRPRKKEDLISTSVRHLQIFSLWIPPGPHLGLLDFINSFRGLRVLEVDRCDLNTEEMKIVLLEQRDLHTLRCAQWTHASAQNLANLQMSFRNCRLQMKREEFVFSDDEDDLKQTLAAELLSEYANFSPVLKFDLMT